MYISIHIHVYGLSINIVKLVNKWQAIKRVNNGSVIQQ
jgi:hypothetical protein